MNNNTEHVRTTVSYRIACGETFSGILPEGDYSQYSKRWRENRDGQLPEGEEVYGLPQAIAHLKEKRADYQYIRRNVPMRIEKVTNIVEVVAVEGLVTPGGEVLHG